GARIVDVIFALVFGEREAIARATTDFAVGVEAQRHRTEEVVAIHVIVAGDRHEIAIVADRLPDAGVELLLANAAVIVERIVVRRRRRREEGARAERGEFARVDQTEDAEELIFARRARQVDAELFGRNHGAIIY